MTALDYLQDASDPRVVEALTRECSICKAPPRKPCRHPWETTEPLNRVVHLARAQHHMDRGK
jgi:hypothetical protein